MEEEGELVEGEMMESEGCWELEIGEEGVREWEDAAGGFRVKIVLGVVGRLEWLVSGRSWVGEESEGGPTGKVWKRAEVFSGCDTLSVLCMQESGV